MFLLGDTTMIPINWKFSLTLKGALLAFESISKEGHYCAGWYNWSWPSRGKYTITLQWKWARECLKYRRHFREPLIIMFQWLRSKENYNNPISQTSNCPDPSGIVWDTSLGKKPRLTEMLAERKRNNTSWVVEGGSYKYQLGPHNQLPNEDCDCHTLLWVYLWMYVHI